ncbi:hypothetical protein [uncultured Anaerococcus sp.]|uniref:hypothetical protein n=1 Tax=uncultured Anaerococcus sp. TaxID=293428 RepID=UPI00288B4B51|nr:hypothetical protein [uncultured Anaerococcus sp.]
MIPKYALEVLTRSLARRIIYQGETIDLLLKKLSKLDKEVKEQLRESLEVYLEENKYEIEKIKMKLALGK